MKVITGRLHANEAMRRRGREEGKGGGGGELDWKRVTIGYLLLSDKIVRGSTLSVVITEA